MPVKQRISLAVLAGVLIAYPGMAVPATFAHAAQRIHHRASGRISYRQYAASAVRALIGQYYTGSGTWNMCVPATCAPRNADWGADSLTYALYLHWELTGDPVVPPIMTALASTARVYSAPDGEWSDGPEWDAVADAREYQVTHSATALADAEAAFRIVDSTDAPHFAAGACPGIDYQHADGGAGKLKTLETDSNYIKAALLLYQATGTSSYLAKAEKKYHAARKYFLSPGSALYTAHVIDSGQSCERVPGLYFASVNGNMIWDGATLARVTGASRYLDQAVATAQSVSRRLVDGTGLFTDLQTEADVVEPLVEGMYLLATSGHQSFARTWLLGAAAAAAAERTPSGAYGRFFNGPPQRGPITAWQANGGFAVMIAAAKLDPQGVPADPWYWRRAVFVPDDRTLPTGPDAAVRLSFDGTAVAIIGYLGEKRPTPPGHGRVLIGGEPLFDQVGIWQGKFSGRARLPDQVLFAWRWPRSGRHLVTITPAPGLLPASTFFHMTGYYVAR